MDVSKAMTYLRDTTIYGRVKLWHVVLFMTLGPTLTWPMLVILMTVFMYENRNIVKDVRGMFSINGGDQRTVSGSSGGNQGSAQGSAQGEVSPGGPVGREVQGAGFEQRFQQAFGGF